MIIVTSNVRIVAFLKQISIGTWSQFISELRERERERERERALDSCFSPGYMLQ